MFCYFKKTLSGEKKKGVKPRMQGNMGFQVYLQVILTSFLLYSMRSLRMIERCYLTTICLLFTNCDSCISSLRRFTVKPGQGLTLSAGSKRTFQNSINKFIIMAS